MSVDAIIIQLKAMDDPASEGQKKALNEAIDDFGNTLNLNKAQLDLKDIKNLCETLKSNIKLQVLGLAFLEGWPTQGDRPFNREPIEAIADLLAVNSTLKTLSLAGNRISDFGANKLCQGLKKNPKSALETLIFTSNEIPLSPFFVTELEGTKLKVVTLAANALTDANSLTGIKSLLRFAPETIERVDLYLPDTNPELSITAVAASIAEKVIRPIRPVTFFGSQTAEHPAIQQAFLDHAQFMKEMEERAKELGQTITEFLPDDVATIVNDYTGLPKSSFESMLKKAESLQQTTASETKPATQVTRPGQISAPTQSPITPPAKTIPKQKEAKSVPIGRLLFVTAPIIALIALGFALSTTVGIAFAAITFASVAGVIGYNVLKNRKSKRTIQPESSSSEIINPPPTVLPKTGPDLAPTPSTTVTKQQTTESVPKNTNAQPSRKNP